MSIPDISVVIPVYQSEQYLPECLEGVLQQTHRNIEVILVDDGSPDKSGQLCDQYAEQDPRIHVIHQKNGGASRARNAGIQLAVGRFICFVDSDDIVDKTYCETMLRLLDDSNFDYCVCGSYRFSGANEKIASYNLVDGILSNQEYLWAQLHRKSEFGFINKLFRREIFDKLRFVEGVHNEDVIFSCDLARNFDKGVICTNKELYGYRMNETGVTYGQKAKADPDFISAARYLIETSQQIGREHFEECLLYAIGYPWFFVDKIYLKRSFAENRRFLVEFRSLIQAYSKEYSKLEQLDQIKRHRMLLFSRSPWLYGLNVYARLIRLYFCKLLRIDPYASGHGI